MEWIGAILLATVVIASWALNLFGLPGNWIILASAAIYAAVMPEEHRATLGWPLVGVLLALAILGEIVEFVAGSAGAKKAGGSRRAAIFSLIGAIAGAFVGMFVGIPIPVVGPIIAAILFAAIGALVGAYIGESQVGGSAEQNWKVGKAAFWGRIFGTIGKAIVGVVMVGVVLVGIVSQ